MRPEMRPYDTRVGEFRVHYAGFFDPGFGYGAGSRAVLEVRAHDVPFVVEDGQPVGRLIYEPMVKTPDKLYRDSIGSIYSGSKAPGQIAFSLYGGSIGSTYRSRACGSASSSASRGAADRVWKKPPGGATIGRTRKQAGGDGDERADDFSGDGGRRRACGCGGL